MERAWNYSGLLFPFTLVTTILPVSFLISGRNGGLLSPSSVGETCNSYIPYYSKNPCPCGNHKFPNEVHHQGLGSMKVQAKCFLGSGDASCWEVCNFHMGMGSCFNPMTYKKHQSIHAEIALFCIPLFYMNCVLLMGLYPMLNMSAWVDNLTITGSLLSKNNIT